MEPKFQSSFIPKGSSNFAPSPATGFKNKNSSSGPGIIGFIAKLFFVIAFLAAAGVFGYKYYLKYDIARMAEDLDRARVEVQPDVVRELVRSNARIVSANELLASHRVLSPFFEFLEVSTPATVRFNQLAFTAIESGLEVTLDGEAAGYGAVALQADLFARNPDLQNQVFSDLSLDERGNVRFKFSALISRNMVSYSRQLERDNPAAAPIPSQEFEPIEPVESADAIESQDIPPTI